MKDVKATVRKLQREIDLVEFLNEIKTGETVSIDSPDTPPWFEEGMLYQISEVTFTYFAETSMLRWTQRIEVPITFSCTMAIRKRSSSLCKVFNRPFRELAKLGPIPLGGAVITGAGKLPFKAIIHVAGINMAWRSSKRSIRDSTRNAIELAAGRGFRSIALPLIGAGTGGLGR